MKYLIKTPYPCLVKTKSEQVELDTNDTLVCVDEQLLYVYPLSNEQIPFCVNLAERYDSDKVSFLRHKDQNIVYLEKAEKFDVFQKEDLNFAGNKHCFVSISKNKVCFETNKQKIDCRCHKSRLSPKVFKVKNFACVQLEEDFFAYNMQNEKLVHLCADSISFDKDTLIATKKYADSNLREKVSKYKIDENITLVDEQIISTQNQATRQEDLISYKFLESVKAGDYDKSEQYLSPSLTGKIGKEQIKSFFGFLSEFLPLSANEFLAISGGEKKYVTFDIQNFKICDISIDEL